MGLMSKLFGGNQEGESTLSAADGSHAINGRKVMASTDADVFTPTNPGEFKSIRSIPVNPDPRYFTPEEAAALRELAKVKGKEATATKRAYKSLRKIDDADVTVHQEHYRYARRLSGNELRKLKSTQLYAKKLHGLRPQYLELSAGLTEADRVATNAIAKIAEGLNDG